MVRGPGPGWGPGPGAGAPPLGWDLSVAIVAPSILLHPFCVTRAPMSEVEVASRWFRWEEFYIVVRRALPKLPLIVCQATWVNYYLNPGVERLYLCGVLFLNIPWV